MWFVTELFRKHPAASSPGQENALTGSWGEDAAVRFLVKRGWKIVGRRVRPCRRDRRCEIDVIAHLPDRKTVVFVEVKTHAARSPRASFLWGVNRRKKNALLRACSNWLMWEKGHGNFRFDVIEVFGRRTDPRPPEIDHFENVPLFPPKWRFW